MQAFNNSEHFYDVVGGFLQVPTLPRTYEDFRQWWGARPDYYEKGDEVEQINEIGRKVGKTGMCTVFEITHPDALICIDAKNPKKGKNFSFYLGSSPVSSDVRVKTTGDVAHQFWGGNVNVTTAIMSGKIKTVGPKHKALKLLPKITPAFALYPRYLELMGEHRLLRML